MRRNGGDMPGHDPTDPHVMLGQFQNSAIPLRLRDGSVLDAVTEKFAYCSCHLGRSVLLGRTGIDRRLIPKFFWMSTTLAPDAFMIASCEEIVGATLS
jgi:hypothetical protein